MAYDSAALQVMVIDDDENTLAAIGSLLESESYGVTLCRSAISALDHLRVAQPDLIVLDLIMPEMTGWQFRVEQKKEVAWAGIPVLAMSGDHSPQAEAIDAAAYLGKPVQERDFLDTVRRLGTDVRRKREAARAGELQRLISLGSLIGGIAHEINNPLAFIEGSLDLLRRQLVTTVFPSASAAVDPLGVASALRALERTKDGVDRIAEVVRCVSMFASADPDSDEVLDVHQVLEASLQVARNEIRHSALVERDYQSVPMTRGNPARLGQVFLNVILNAVRSIRAANQSDSLIIVKTQTIHERIVVTISDTASTLDPSAQREMFDPLTSVAPGRVGLHFGLAVSREIVEAMGGVIEVHARHPRGTDFCITLPSCTQATYAPPKTKRLELAAKNRVSIMVIDDDPLMCEVLAAMLSPNYEVAAFTSPRAGLAVLLEGKVDLILCDVMMPELSGVDLYDRVSRERPELADRFIFLTGGAFTERARLFLKRIDRPLVTKPFARRQLFDAIEQVLLAGVTTGATVEG